MSSFKEKNLLIVSYYLPPTKTVATVRIFNFHLEAQKHFKEVFSMTTTNRRLLPKDEFDFDDGNTSEIWTFDLRRFFIKENKPSTGVGQGLKESKFAKWLSKLIYSFPFNIFLDDGGLTYILGGFIKGREIIKTQKIEVLFSSYKPYADHLICFLLKKWNPKLIWVADFRDLHVDNIRKNVHLPKMQKWFNRQILKRPDIVTTVSQGLAKKLESFHPDVYVLRNGIPSTAIFEKKKSSFDKFTISYTGSIYPKLQTAELLFKVLQKLITEQKIDVTKIELIYAGKENQVWDAWIEKFHLQKINTTHGFLSKKEAQEIQQNSHVNLLLSWSSENQQGILTAKFYDYLLAQKPILLLINGSQDEEFETIFKELNAGLVAYDNVNFQQAVEDFISGKYLEWEKQGKVSSAMTSKNLAQFRWDIQMNDFLKNLEKKL